VNTHLHDPQLIGYVHFTLTDAERETMDVHLSDCARCRARLETFESLERRVRYDLSADIKSASPPSTMTFSAIAPRLERRSRWDRLRLLSDHLVPGAAAFAALAGLVVALISVLYALGWSDARTATESSSALPLLASGLFAVAIAGNFGWRARFPRRVLLSRLLALVLWIGTALVGLQVIVTVLDLVTWLLFSGVSSRSATLGPWVLIPLGIGWIALVIGGGEFHYEHLGEPSSWRLFAATICAEAFILILPFILDIWFNLPSIWR
jgi:anti-sigma factor RsiW